MGCKRPRVQISWPRLKKTARGRSFFIKTYDPFQPTHQPPCPDRLYCRDPYHCVFLHWCGTHSFNGPGLLPGCYSLGNRCNAVWREEHAPIAQQRRARPLDGLVWHIVRGADHPDDPVFNNADHHHSFLWNECHPPHLAAVYWPDFIIQHFFAKFDQRPCSPIIYKTLTPFSLT